MTSHPSAEPGASLRSCVWCESTLKPAPTDRPFVSSAGKHICVRCIRQLAALPVEYLFVPGASLRELIAAAEKADWMQVVLNEGPPCFHLEKITGLFCLRAQRWAGHTEKDEWPEHRFVSLADLLREAADAIGAGTPYIEDWQCQGTVNGYVRCELRHGHDGPCGYAPTTSKEGAVLDAGGAPPLLVPDGSLPASSTAPPPGVPFTVSTETPEDQARIAAIRARVEQATKGPWWTGPHYKCDVDTPLGTVRSHALYSPQAAADALFIANAREDIPYLLDLLASSRQPRPEGSPVEPQPQREGQNFVEALETLVNAYSQENASNTPDFILAQYLASCLSAWNTGVQQRETWHGRDPRPAAAIPSPPPAPDAGEKESV